MLFDFSPLHGPPQKVDHHRPARVFQEVARVVWERREGATMPGRPSPPQGTSGGEEPFHVSSASSPPTLTLGVWVPGTFYGLEICLI